MSQEARRIQKISAQPGPVPGAGTVREEKVAKLIDVTTCIGCRACEVACQEWNDLPFADTTFQNNFQTLPDTAWNLWTLITMNEVQSEDGALQWLLRKQGCMHCADPGCLAACPSPGAIVQYENGIVDFNHDACIGCQYCTIGCPFNVPKFNPKTKKCSSARSAPTACRRDWSRLASRRVQLGVSSLAQKRKCCMWLTNGRTSSKSTMGTRTPACTIHPGLEAQA